MNKRILVVDDDENIRDTMELLLGIAGFTVSMCATGKDIFNTIAKENPDLLLLDIYLGELDGREICKAIKKNPATSSIPVIMVSVDEKIYNTISANGANDVVAKPFTEETLLSRVKRQLAFRS